MTTVYRSLSAAHQLEIFVAFEDVPREVLLAAFARRQFVAGARLLIQHGQTRPDGSCTNCFETAPCRAALQGARQALTYATDVLGIDFTDEYAEPDSATPGTNGEPVAESPLVSAGDGVAA